MLEIKFDVDQLGQLSKSFPELKNKLPKATAMAINRSLAMTKTEQVRRARAMYTIKYGDLLADLKIVKATTSTLYGSIESRGNVIGLDHFKLDPKTRNKKRVKAGVKGSRMKNIPNAFIAYNDGRLGGFIRTGKSSLPIKRLKGPSAPQMLGEMSILDYLQGFAEEKFNMRFEHEMGRLIK